MSEYPPNLNYDERIAHVVWAAHILSYLTGGQNNSTPQLPEPDDDEDFDADELDAETDKGRVLTDSDHLLRYKFLDCVAELLSPSKGWHHVVVAGLRESEDFIDIDLSRNDGFNTAQSDKSVGESQADLHSYLGHLQKYLFSAFEQVLHDLSVTSLNWFELIAIKFNRERIDYWIEKVKLYVAGKTPSQDGGEKRSPEFQSAFNRWTDVTKLFNHSDTRKDILREQIVHKTYECVITIDVYQVLQRTFGSRTGTKVWNALRFIARPMSNCRLLIRIARQLPHFRTVSFFPIPSGPNTNLTPEYLVDINDAWGQLVSMTPSGSELKTIAKFRAKFNRDCARSFGSHAEVKLFLHYTNNGFLTPSVDYFGCSKKTCFLCEVFLRATPHPISTRGRHGICYPAWGVPVSRSSEVAAALQELEKVLVSRIEMHLKGQSGKLCLNQVPQSTVISDFPALSLEELSRKDDVKKSVEENRKTLQKERRILDGQASNSNSSNRAIEPYDSCVMCNSSLAKLCGRCLDCHYCSRECQSSDWPSHKLLCKKLSSQSPRPSTAHKRAILFPEKDAEPLIIWVLCSRKASSEYEEYGILLEYETANIHPLLGADDPFPGRAYIQRNVKRCRNLGFGLATGTRKEGYSIVLSFREAFLRDGSTINRSILESVKTSGTVHHTWRGPIVAMRTAGNEFYGDISLADFRHVIDYFVMYNSSEVREIANPQHLSRTTATIHGVKISCYGEIKLHGAEPYVQVEVQEVHPIRSRILNEGDVSPISKLLGTPIRLWKFPDTDNWNDLPGWDENMCPESNPDAAFLMTESDPGREDWGWAPMYWNHFIGNVLVVRADESDLSVGELRLMCYFIRRVLQPMVEDALGAGNVSRTRQEVLNFITHENMEKSRGKMEKDEMDSAF